MLKVHLSSRQKFLRPPKPWVTRILRLAAPPAWNGAEVSVAVVGRDEMASLNRRHTGRDRETDVLAFPLGDETDRTIGEIVVCAAVALDEAEARGIAPEDELALYLVHGALHLQGYDDHSPGDRRRMYAREAEILQRAGLRDVRGCARKRKRPAGTKRRPT